MEVNVKYLNIRKMYFIIIMFEQQEVVFSLGLLPVSDESALVL